MAPSLSFPPLPTALLEVEPEVPRSATCPLCHTEHPALTESALNAGGEWQCVRCGQRWDAARLATVAAYAAWALEHDTVGPGRSVVR
jgi:transcription elongation factor Elf1